MSETITITAADLLAMIGFRAQQIVASVNATATGATPPRPEAVQEALDQMNDLCSRLRSLTKATPDG